MENWDEQAAPVVAELPEIKLFGKWSTDDVQVSDISLTVSTEQGSHRLEKYLNIQDCLEKSLKMKFVLKST